MYTGMNQMEGDPFFKLLSFEIATHKELENKLASVGVQRTKMSEKTLMYR